MGIHALTARWTVSTFPATSLSQYPAGRGSFRFPCEAAAGRCPMWTAALRDTQHSSGRREPSERTGSRSPRHRRIRARQAEWDTRWGSGTRDAKGRPRGAGRAPAWPVVTLRASTTLPQHLSGHVRPLLRWQTFRFRSGLLRMPPAGLEPATRCLEGTSRLLRSTAACRSACATSDGPHIAAAVYAKMAFMPCPSSGVAHSSRARRGYGPSPYAGGG